MVRRVPSVAVGVALAAGAAAGAYRLLLKGGLVVDLDIGRQRRPLGPISRHIAAPPEVVFDVIAAPYLGRTPKAMEAKLQVIERGADLVLAAHHTPVAGGLTATTVETVRFDRERHQVHFRLLRGPIPAVTEMFDLRASATGTEFVYSGEMETDLWSLGRWWAARVAPSWERTVAASLDRIAEEAERRQRARAASGSGSVDSING